MFWRYYLRVVHCTGSVVMKNGPGNGQEGADGQYEGDDNQGEGTHNADAD